MHVIRVIWHKMPLAASLVVWEARNYIFFILKVDSCVSLAEA